MTRIREAWPEEALAEEPITDIVDVLLKNITVRKTGTVLNNYLSIFFVSNNSIDEVDQRLDIWPSHICTGDQENYPQSGSLL